MKTHTLLTASSLCGLLTASSVHAQAIVPDGFGGYYDPMEGQQDLYDWSRDYLDKESRRFGSPVHETDEYRSWDRLRALESCNVLANNPRARELCLQGIR